MPEILSSTPRVNVGRESYAKTIIYLPDTSLAKHKIVIVGYIIAVARKAKTQYCTTTRIRWLIRFPPSSSRPPAISKIPINTQFTAQVVLTGLQILQKHNTCAAGSEDSWPAQASPGTG